MESWEELKSDASKLQGARDELLKKHIGLHSYADATAWDNETCALIALMQEFQGRLGNFRAEQEEVLEGLKQEHSQRSFFQKAFASHERANDARAYVESADLTIKSIDADVETLEGMMDKTPGSRSEQKEIVDELRQLKKELTLEKRQINENLRQIRTISRQKAVGWSGPTYGKTGRQVARFARAQLRLNKERELSPHEDQKTLIERELIALEKDLIWVMHFRGDNGNAEPSTPSIIVGTAEEQRCAYCGRRNNGGTICEGCGASL